ncbi:MAG: chemotaxis protein CheW [Gemmatimonadota bacterium]
MTAAPRDAGRALLTVDLGEARFGLWVDEVLEIVRTPPISRLPLPGREVAGVTSVRGDVIPVLDLGLRLLDAAAQRPGHLVLVRHDASDALVGLLVDRVGTLIEVTDDAVREPPPAAEALLPPPMMAGVVAHDEGVVTILHLGRAAAPPEVEPSEDGRI